MKKRRNVSHLFRILNETGCTSIVTSEIRSSVLEREFQFEEYLAQGVVVMQMVPRGGEMARIIHIEKMRGTPHDSQPRPYRITEKGIEIYPKERAV
jgi:KaiC/GvpD/RAD55 family RecA-like ATPase